jgi:hypothetical protein
VDEYVIDIGKFYGKGLDISENSTGTALVRYVEQQLFFMVSKGPGKTG